MQLPDIYFAFDWRRGERPLYFHRDRGGAILRVTASNLIPAEGSLLIYGPGTPVWDDSGLALLASVRDRGGAVLPLGAILERCGFPSRIRREDLLERLGGSHIDLEDPRREGREILERLGEILHDLDVDIETDRVLVQKPRALIVADIMCAPDAPGVYTFLSSEGEAIYIGKARSLRRRLTSHFQMRGGEPSKRAALIAGATEVRWEETGSELEALVREYMALRRDSPNINTQRIAHRRPRGRWRDRAVALLLPSVAADFNEVFLVAGDGRFHAERVLRSSKMPRGFWKHVTAFLEGAGGGKGPGGKTLKPNEAAELAEIALSWIVIHGLHVSQIDLSSAIPSPELKVQFTRWLSLDSRSERVEIR